MIQTIDLALVGGPLIVAAFVGIGLAVRYWPLAWAATVRRERARATAAEHRATAAEQTAARDRAARAAAEHERSEARDRMTRMQVSFDRVMRDRYDEYDREGRRLLLVVEDQRSVMFAAVSRIDVRTAVDRSAPMARHVDVPLIHLAVSIGLSEGCPPELVADQLGRQVQAAVLQQWQGQSLLLR